MRDDRDRFLELLRGAVSHGELVKLTLGRYRGADRTLRNLFVRPLALQSGPRLGLVWRHTTREVAKNYVPADALRRIEPLIGGAFQDAHLFTPGRTAQLECGPPGPNRLHVTGLTNGPVRQTSHDRPKLRAVAPDSGWLQALGVTDKLGKPRESMAPKFRQIERFAELLSHLLVEGGLNASDRPLRVVDMGCGKGYLTFAVSSLLGPRARVLGVEARADLVELCNRVAAEHGFAPDLSFTAGTIASTPLQNPDILIALHACDTATDDALARGIREGTKLILVSPCCQKELRPDLAPAPALEGALKHGIFQERMAEFATDALRAQLLEWSGYRTKAFEFVSTEHTAKNLMISAIRTGERPPAAADSIRRFAALFGIRRQSLARQLGFDLSDPAAGSPPPPVAQAESPGA